LQHITPTPDAAECLDDTDRDIERALSDVYPAIEDYAVIGDCRTIALIARSGAIEWLCLPNFASASVFAALLDRRLGGAFTLCPVQEHTSQRQYIKETAILETLFTTATGRVRVLDFFSIGDGNSRWQEEMQPQRELIRLVEGLEGEVELLSVIEPRPDYGRCNARVNYRRGFGWVFQFGASALVLNTDFTVSVKEPERLLLARAIVRAGDLRTISLSFADRDIAVQPAVGERALNREQVTRGWWRAWASQCVYNGEHQALIVRSAITLKLLTYSLTGAVIAAPTTSLPESIGGGRNWDYRFCWLRDASITMGALLGLGLQGEASSFLGWLLHSTRLTRPELRILYDLYGRNDDREKELDHWAGYRCSAPVRIGNAAGSQLQLDTYGSVILAAYDYIDRMGSLRGGELRMLRDFGEVVCRRWQEPDHGMWEIRGEPRHFTYTKLMCWAALDRVIKLSERGLLRIPAARFRTNREAIERTIESRGYNNRHQSYVAELDGEDAADASVLLMGWVGYGDVRSSRLLSSRNWIMHQLERNGLYDRYPHGFDGEKSREGCFSICSAWAVDLMARQGDLAGAKKVFTRLAETANDLGLFAEEYDPENETSLGNFPQAFTHSGLITAALAIQRAEQAGLEVPS
jgi:GH15 family glucan-1,4-alpha-glucosidase